MGHAGILTNHQVERSSIHDGHVRVKLMQNCTPSTLDSQELQPVLALKRLSSENRLANFGNVTSHGDGDFGTLF
jgi:hypothetical protein